MRPCQFVAQCATNWECVEKLKHSAQVAFIKALPEFNCLLLGYVFQQPITIFSLGGGLFIQIYRILFYPPARSISKAALYHAQ